MLKIFQKESGAWVELEQNRFTFNDGQRHLSIRGLQDGSEVAIEARITSSHDLFDLMLAKEILANHRGIKLDLYVKYMPGRMDRALADDQPFTLLVYTQCLNIRARDLAQRVFILDPHSDASIAYLQNAYAVYPISQIEKAIQSELTKGKDLTIVAPDKGAKLRLEAMRDQAPPGSALAGFRTIAHCVKDREPLTGELRGFALDDPAEMVQGRRCLIVDDICDGGRTFVGVADVLLKNGADSVALYVTHGIFSNGYYLKGIENIYTTDSFSEQKFAPSWVRVLDSEMGMRNG